MNGKPLKVDDLIRLHFAKNDEGEMVDPVTYKVFTDNTHIVALRNTGNVFAYDTVERLNIKAKMWKDLVSDEDFSRKDIITLQDPQNVQSRNLSSFKYLQDGISTLTEEQKRERNAGVNRSALGNAASVLKPKDESPTPAKPQVGKYLHQTSKPPSQTPTKTPPQKPSHTSKQTPYNASQHTTGLAAASFTSTGLTPHTSAALALLSDEEYLLHPRRVTLPGYVLLSTTHGPLILELLPEHAPRAVWNFLQLCKHGYYTSTPFHRNIRNFMLQGGDPTGTGKGGTSCWSRTFDDELDGPLRFSTRGMVGMANKGKNTNSSQFFITYRAASHLDRKHTIFARVVENVETLDIIENVEVDEGNRPVAEVRILEAKVLVDPFEEFLKKKEEREEREKVEEGVRKSGGREDERVTWTGRRVGGERGGASGEEEGIGIGRYIGGGGGAAAAIAPIVGVDGTSGGRKVPEVLEEWEREQPARKKVKAGGGGGGFGNFDSW